MPTIVYKILDAADWASARDAGIFVGSDVDKQDGFIHLSAPNQVRETATKWFAGRENLLLVGFDAHAIGASLVWEASRGGALFPHVYGPLPTRTAVTEVTLAIGPSGDFIFPSVIP